MDENQNGIELKVDPQDQRQPQPGFNPNDIVIGQRNFQPKSQKLFSKKGNNPPPESPRIRKSDD